MSDAIDRGRQALEEFWAEHSDGARNAAEYLAKHPDTRRAWGRQPLGLTPRERDAAVLAGMREAELPPSKKERKRRKGGKPKQRHEQGAGNHRAKKCAENRRRKVYERDGFQCVACRLYDPTGALLTLDHIIPKSKGGRNTFGNLQTMCAPCNNAKGNAA